MAIDLNTLFTSLGIVSGNTQSKDQYEFYNGIVWDDATVTYNQKEFFDKVGMSRYEFFKQYGDERSFYDNVDDTRISDFKTFYEYAGEYLVGAAETIIWVGSNIYAGGAELQAYDSDFNLITELEINRNVREILVGGDELFVYSNTSTTENTITRFDMSGVTQSTWSDTRENVGTLGYKQMSLDVGNNVYLSCSTGNLNSTIRKYTKTGSLTWDSSLKSYNYTCDVDVNGNIIVGGGYYGLVDLPKHKTFAVYDSDRNLIFAATSSETTFTSVASFDPDGNIYAGGDNFVKKWDSSGNFLYQLSTATPTRDTYQMKVDKSGNVYIGFHIETSGTLYAFKKYDSSGNLVFGNDVGGYNASKKIYGITIDQDENVYVTSNIDNNIRKYSSTGTLLTTFDAGRPIISLAAYPTMEYKF